MADVTRRQAFGLALGAASGVGLAGCSNQAPTAVSSNDAPPLLEIEGAARFDHGVASGDALHDRVVLWTRVTPSLKPAVVDVHCHLSTRREDLEMLPSERVFSGEAKLFAMRTGPDRDYTVKIDADGLSPETSYYYQFVVRTADGLITSPIGRTRTFAESGLEQLGLAVISCSNFPFGYFNVYRALSQRDDVDAIVHLGDYLYEYGVDGYGGETGAKLGRNHNPITEIVTLDDYRTRHAQYKADPDLQAAHGAHPWFCTWDDHESTNNSYRTGAQNHNPEENEGNWSDRKQRAVQAYLEWMPVRDPKPGMAREAIYRSFQFGDLATLFMLEGRLTGRSEEISWFTELAEIPAEEVPAKAFATMRKVGDPDRTMLGSMQESWLDEGLKASTAKGTTWQVLGNQVIVAEVKPPQFTELLTPEEIAGLPGFAQQLVQFAPLNLPFNLDAWDGFPAARERLFDSAKSAGARLITLTGDTHTAWANQLHDVDGQSVGAEFGCTSVSSPGMGTYLPFEDLGTWIADANEDVVWHKPFDSGFFVLTLTPDRARSRFYSIASLTERTTETRLDAAFEIVAEPDGSMGPVTEV